MIIKSMELDEFIRGSKLEEWWSRTGKKGSFLFLSLKEMVKI